MTGQTFTVMQGGLLKFLQEVIGFALIGGLFFMWFLGYLNNDEDTRALDYNMAKAGIENHRETPAENRTYESTAYERPRSRGNNGSSAFNSADYDSPDFERPAEVAREALNSRSAEAAPETPAAVSHAVAIRSWKGVHREEDYARMCFELFRNEVADLSLEYGLYPEVFMARIIAYSYGYTINPVESPVDNNMTGMKQPKGEQRARFRTTLESLKAYAVVNAGEINRLSEEGALAKHDRAWTMRKIIENNAFVENLKKTIKRNREYAGMMGPASRVSEEEELKLEGQGETIKIISSVESTVKERRAKSAGYDSWEDYLESIPEGRQAEQEEDAKAVISAVSKKKAFGMGRRLEAKKRKRNE